MLWKCSQATYAIVEPCENEKIITDTMFGTAFLFNDKDERLVIGFYKNPSIVSKTDVYGKAFGDLSIAIGFLLGYALVKVGVATVTGKSPSKPSASSGSAKFFNRHWDSGVEQIKDADYDLFAISDYKQMMYVDECICECYKMENNFLMLSITELDTFYTHLIAFRDSFLEKKKNKVLLKSLGITNLKELKE